jgi:hypothetical protein
VFNKGSSVHYCNLNYEYRKAVCLACREKFTPNHQLHKHLNNYKPRAAAMSDEASVYSVSSDPPELPVVESVIQKLELDRDHHPGQVDRI